MKEINKIHCVFIMIPLLALKLTLVSVVLAGSGDLDPTFDGDGKLIYNLYNDPKQAREFTHAVAIQPDGKILAAGMISPNATIARYQSDGSLDSGFGQNGFFKTFMVGNASFNALALQPDGKILAAGNHFDFLSEPPYWADRGLVCRINPDGTPDLTFGDYNGCRYFQWEKPAAINYQSYIYGLALQSDGKIVVVGNAWDLTNNQLHNFFAVARLNPDGSFDAGFSGDGKLVTGFGLITDTFGSSFANAVAVHPTSGKIVVAGYVIGSTDGENIALKMLNADGSLDPSFGSTFLYTGRITDFSGGDDRANAVAFEGSKVLVAGTAALSGSGQDFALARYNSNGSLDSGFGFGGRVATSFGGQSDIIYGMKLQPDGKIITAGQRTSFFLKQLARDFALARYHANGLLDTTFSGDGKVTTDFGTTSDVAKAVAVQTDGKIVAVGFAGPESYKDKFALARYEP